MKTKAPPEIFKDKYNVKVEKGVITWILIGTGSN